MSLILIAPEPGSYDGDAPSRITGIALTLPCLVKLPPKPWTRVIVGTKCRRQSGRGQSAAGDLRGDAESRPSHRASGEAAT